MIFGILAQWYSYAYIGVAISSITIFVLMLIITLSLEDIKNIEITIETNSQKRKFVQEILASENVIAKNQIKQLHRRLSKRLNGYRKNSQSIMKNIVSVFQFLLIPFILIIITNIWIVNTNSDNFFKGVFSKLDWCHIVKRRMNTMVIKPVYII